jgi:hypothetical protein
MAIEKESYGWRSKCSVGNGLRDNWLWGLGEKMLVSFVLVSSLAP